MKCFEQNKNCLAKPDETETYLRRHVMLSDVDAVAMLQTPYACHTCHGLEISDRLE